MNNSIVRSVKQRGTAIVEYVVILSFVCVVGWGFVGSDNGMTGSIGSIINSVERLLGMTGVVYVDEGKWLNFKGTGSGTANLGGGTFSENGGWTWKHIYTDDNGDRYAGSAFLESTYDNSKNASEAAKQLIDAMFEQGSFGGVDPVSWAFTEGCEAGSVKQSLNLYWSNSDWFNIPEGQQVPIMQMNKEDNGDVKYYVAMANVSNGKLELWNQAAALKGNVTYVKKDGGTVPIECDMTSKQNNGVLANTSSLKLGSEFAFTDYNKAQEAYYKLVAENGITVNNSYKKSN